MVFMVFGLWSFCSLSRGFMRFHSSTEHCFGILLWCTVRLCCYLIEKQVSSDALRRPSTRQCWCHRSFQFSPRILENFFVFFVIWIDKVNSSHFSIIVELWFFFCPFLFLSILSGFTNFRPNFWPYMIWSGTCLNLCQSLPGPHASFWRYTFQQGAFCESCPRIWQMSARIDIPIIVNSFLL